jgi:flagellar assembly factor FliW
MQTHTSEFDVSASSPALTLRFPTGLLGFPDVNEYVLLDMEPGMPFKCLQAANGHDLTFVVMNPLMLMPDYQITIEEQDLRDLDVHDQKDLCFLAILTIPQDAPEQATANLQGPILVNTKNYWAKQLALVQSPYHTCHSLLELINAPA